MADDHPLVAYLAHPVGAPDEAGVQANVQRGLRWLRWLVERTDLAVTAPWVGHVLAFLGTDADANAGTGAVHPIRARGMRDNLAVVDRCDLVVLCGDRVSSGMAEERDGGAIASCDLTVYGLAEPPQEGSEVEHQMFADIADAVAAFWAEVRRVP